MEFKHVRQVKHVLKCFADFWLRSLRLCASPRVCPRGFDGRIEREVPILVQIKGMLSDHNVAQIVGFFKTKTDK